MSEQWYVRREHGAIDGPFLERQIAEGLSAGAIGEGQFVRQGEAGDWHEAHRVRAVFQQLSEIGWYVRLGSESYGPFTEKKLLDLHQTGNMEPGSEIRQGTSGSWKSAEKVLSLWQSQKTARATDSAESGSAVSTGILKWSTEPIRHVVMSVRLAAQDTIPRLQPLERLLLKAASVGEEAAFAVSSTDQR